MSDPIEDLAGLRNAFAQGPGSEEMRILETIDLDIELPRTIWEEDEPRWTS